MNKTKVCVVGLGYIGLPTALVLSSAGYRVFGCDIDTKAVDDLNSGRPHILEPGVREFLESALAAGHFSASERPVPSDIYMIAVPTPYVATEARGEQVKRCDLTYVESAVRMLAPLLKSGDSVILESTSSIGATNKIVRLLTELRPDLRFPEKGKTGQEIAIAYCPERVIPGNTFNELVNNDRIIGGVTHDCAEQVGKFYGTFVNGECLLTSAETAEMAKLTENAFRDVNIAFANELSMICDDVNVDVWELVELANRHPRVNILEPGPGVGGHCIAVDPWFLAEASPDISALVTTARRVNDRKPMWVCEKIMDLVGDYRNQSIGEPREAVTVGLFGMAFKPNIDDFRESPSIDIAKNLMRLDDSILLVGIDPMTTETSICGVPMVPLIEALDQVDIAVLLVAHDEFINKKPRTQFVVDFKGVWVP